MTNYTRLTKRYSNGELYTHCLREKCHYWEKCSKDEKDHCRNLMMEKLAELEDKIENKTIIIPKFKVGEVAFFVVRNIVHVSIITDIKIHIFRSNHCKIQYRLTSPDGYMNYKNENNLYLTKTEAEATLKRGTK